MLQPTKSTSISQWTSAMIWSTSPACADAAAGMRESLNAGIGVLMGVTTIVLGCFARFFVVLAKRAKAAAER